ncbi:MAG: response regulator [Desulfobacterales bacterium]|jgi:DNA-binding NarL/FixJ family response regulator
MSALSHRKSGKEKRLPEILLVDSHPTFRRLVREMISRHHPNIHVQEAQDEKDALGKIRRYRPDLILTEIDLQGRRIPDLPEEMQAIHPGSVVAVLTDCDLPEYRDVALKSGARHFISKSLPNGKAILEVIDETLDLTGTHDQGREPKMTSRNEYQRLAEARLEELAARIAQLKAQAKQADARARLGIEKQVDGLQERSAQIRQKLIQLKDAGENAFADLKAGTEMALTELKTALDDAAARFKG